MNYYKLIDNDEIIGVIASNDFMTYFPEIDSYLRTDESTGEFVSYKGKFYRSNWMLPPQIQTNYKEIIIVNISEEEYNIYLDAIKSNRNIDELEVKYEIINNSNSLEIIIDPINQSSIDFIRQSKLNEMSHACRTTIEEGFDIELRGETKHFSLDTQDQLNLMSLGQLTQTMSLIPYHADGEACDFYAAEEIELIISAANAYKIYHTTYYNSLKAYINSLETIEDIAAVTYGMDIPEEYQTDVLKALNGGN